MYASYKIFKECFTFFDKEATGMMPTQDVGLALRACGALISDREVKTLVNKYDSSHKGKIVFEDFLQMMLETNDKLDN